MQDLALSIVFVVCQLLLLGLLFGLVILRKPEPAKSPPIFLSSTTFLLGVAAGMVIMTAVIDIRSFQFQRSPGVRATAEAWQGRPMIARFDEDACLKFEFGVIACETDYLARYDASANRWTVTGYSNAGKRVVTMTTSNSDARPGRLSIWGALSQFDDNGIVRRFDQIVGTIRVQSGQEQNLAKGKLTAAAMQGKALIIRIDDGACTRFELGAIACGTNYRAQYQAGTNRWTVTGYSRRHSKVITKAADNGDETLGSLSIWGAIFGFDDEGTVYRLDQKVGTIRLLSPEDQVSQRAMTRRIGRLSVTLTARA